MKYPKQIQLNIRAARERLGITQEQLAIALGVSRITVNRWENGSRLPSILVLAKIAELVGCSVKELL